MSDKKKLMNEVLPDPKKAGATGAVRARVVNHLREVVAVSAATVAVNACSTTPFGVVDPLPQPARCANVTDLISDLSATAVRAADGGQTITLTIGTENAEEAGSLTLDNVMAATGGTISPSHAIDPTHITVEVTPTAPMVELFLNLTCQSYSSGSTPKSLHVVIDTTTLKVTLTAP